MKKRFSTILIAIMLILISVISVFSKPVPVKAENRHVRIGYYNMGDFQKIDEKGNASGFNFDYLSMVAQINGWECEYVNVGTFLNGKNMLDRHEIDLIAPCPRMPERMELYEYGNVPLVTEQPLLVTLPTNDKYYYDDFVNFNNMKVATLVDSSITNEFIAYMGQNGFQAQCVYTSDIQDSLQLLQNGDVDAVVATRLQVGGNYKVIAQLGTTQCYYVTWKGNTELINELDYAMRLIEEAYGGWLDTLNDKYFSSYDKQYFTRAEMEYIAAKKVVRVAYIESDAPILFKDGKSGTVAGISAALFDHIQSASGLEFEYISVSEEELTYEYLIQNHIDIVAGVEYNSININKHGMILSVPYLACNQVLVGKEGIDPTEMEDGKIAVVESDSEINAEQLNEFDNAQYVTYDSLEQCYQALEKGEVDFLLADQYVVEYWQMKPRYNMFSTYSMEGNRKELSFAVIADPSDGDNQSWNNGATLVRILDKSISEISKEEMDEIIIRETIKNSYALTAVDILYNYRYVLAVIVCIVIGSFIVLIYIIRMKRKNERLHREEQNQMFLQRRRYQMVIDYMGDLIYEYNVDGTLTIAADKFNKKFGWNIEKEIKNINYGELTDMLQIHEKDEEVFRESTLKVTCAKVADEITVRLRNTENEYIWCKFLRLPIVDAQNELVSVIEIVEDIDHEFREMKRLEVQSKTDGMTGLLNKETFLSRMNKYLESATSKMSCMIFIDMDYFKEINDTFGHYVGDAVIRETAKKIQIIFSNYDLVARFGGDEFCVFVKDIPRLTLEYKLEWAVEKLRATYKVKDEQVKITSSIGAAYCFRENASFQEIFDIADAAVYEAKENGRNQFVIKDMK